MWFSGFVEKKKPPINTETEMQRFLIAPSWYVLRSAHFRRFGQLLAMAVQQDLCREGARWRFSVSWTCNVFSRILSEPILTVLPPCFAVLYYF